MNEDRHIIQLDGLRFFAVLMVMIGHWLQWQWSNQFLMDLPFVHGVTLFFVLSGFLITRILLKRKDELISTKTETKQLFKNFYIRRFLRISPIYYLLIFSFFIIDYKNTRDLFPWLLTYSSNIFQSINNVYVGEFNHFWSLAVEEQFYLFWPFIIIFVKPNRVLLTICLTIICAIISKVFFYLFIGKWMATSFFTLNCMHALGIGGLLAYITLYKKRIAELIARPIWLYSMFIFFLILLLLDHKLKVGWYREIGSEFLFACLSALIILRASKNGFRFGLKYILENKFVAYSGKISYGLYVYHLFIPSLFYIIAPRIGLSISNKYTSFIAFYFLTFLVAHYSWVIFEKPIIALKSRFPYVKGK